MLVLAGIFGRWDAPGLFSTRVIILLLIGALPSYDASRVLAFGFGSDPLTVVLVGGLFAVVGATAVYVLRDSAW